MKEFFNKLISGDDTTVSMKRFIGFMSFLIIAFVILWGVYFTIKDKEVVMNGMELLSWIVGATILGMVADRFTFGNKK